MMWNKLNVKSIDDTQLMTESVIDDALL